MSFFDYSTKEKKRIVSEAAKEGSREQRETMKSFGLTSWEKELSKQFPYRDMRIDAFIEKILSSERSCWTKELRSRLPSHYDPVGRKEILEIIDEVCV